MPCHKVPYKSKAETLYDIKLIKANIGHRGHARDKKSNKKMRPYCCIYCGFWHITTQKHLKYSMRRKNR